MEEKKREIKHNVIIESREKTIISGVIDIHSFDDELVLVETELGILTVKGLDLKMNKLNLESSELIVDGKILALIYSDSEGAKKGNMLNKLFK